MFKFGKRIDLQIQEPFYIPLTPETSCYGIFVIMVLHVVLIPA